MLLLGIIVFLLLSPVYFLAPGFFFVRKLRCSASEKLCASMGLSLIILYLAAFIIYWTKADWHWSWLWTIGWLAMGAISWRELWPFLQRHVVRTQLFAYALLVTIGLLLLGLIRHYSGGMWAGDWFEHYQRMRFFLHYLPLDTKFIETYILPSRPPMMHLISAYLLGHFAPPPSVTAAGNPDPWGFELFQIVALFLNALVFFPCVLLAGQLAKFGLRRIWLIAALLATCPIFMQNITWPWNKLMAGFFIILSLAFYVRGWRNHSQVRLIASAVSMAAAIIVHYSAGPYAVFLFLHYLWNFARGKRKLTEALWTSAATATLLITWFGWSILNYGTAGTFGSNTTVTDAQTSLNDQIKQMGVNIFNTIVPHPLHVSYDRFNIDLVQPNPFGVVRDYTFNLYQPNLIFGFGSVGGFLVIYVLIKQLRQAERSVAWFWTGFVAFVIPVGIAVHSANELFGVMHVCLQPITMIGRTLLAAGFFALTPRMRWGFVFSLVLDVVVGILLQFRMEMHQIIEFMINRFHVVPISNGLLNCQAIINSLFRLEHDYTYLGDYTIGLRHLILLFTVLLFGCVLLMVANMAATGRVNLKQAPRLIVVNVIVLYVAGTILCLSDRALGYVVSHDLPIRSGVTLEEYNLGIQPLLREVAAHSENGEVYYNLSVTAYYHGQIQTAGNAIWEALLLDPDNLRYRYFFAIVNKLDKVALLTGNTVIDVLLRTYRGNGPNFANYAFTVYSTGFKSKGRNILYEAVRTFPDSAEVHESYSAALLDSGQIADAIAQFKIALKIRGEPPAKVAYRIRTLLQTCGLNDAAIDDLVGRLPMAD
ncbi:MAG TPA: tetratricopeptide repeat protein [Tepidisphaeraceae bacterium]|nr:tetratricopeptide repeat protein [Tepidisphaeraceae bacterium]